MGCAYTAFCIHTRLYLVTSCTALRGEDVSHEKNQHQRPQFPITDVSACPKVAVTGVKMLATKLHGVRTTAT
eukprot:6196132-Prymnesium_polylepis.1